jgi:hypothetical protein
MPNSIVLLIGNNLLLDDVPYRAVCGCVLLSPVPYTYTGYQQIHQVHEDTVDVPDGIRTLVLPDPG